MPDNKPRRNLNFGLNVHATQKNFSGSPGGAGNISGADNGTRRKYGVRFLIYGWDSDKRRMGELIYISPFAMIL